ncbi:hypothetical protein [Bradyrhizobium aeschynomenes]|uniref:hypothetical protein n=1 Tax=Bradyrhizobium aeschynomenes TaxID=2734909 RepID=UPI00155629B1|nr:hypothetical protein [Bradyrhizobium aeschynomenes]NPV22115.1 hypothetical protein [Bradyrhizobium aeschynomenes]
MSETGADLRPLENDFEGAKSGPLNGPASSASDAALIALELQFNAISAELLSLEQLRDDRTRCLDSALEGPGQLLKRPGSQSNTSDESITSQIEMVLTRLDPIERAIMQTQACTIAGLGVKARHAAYVMSQCWEHPIDQIDWNARAVRLLIEAVCQVARTPLPVRNRDDG